MDPRVAVIDKKWKLFGYINRNLELIGKMEYQHASDVESGIGIVKQDDKFGLVEIVEV